MPNRKPFCSDSLLSCNIDRCLVAVIHVRTRCYKSCVIAALGEEDIGSKQSPHRCSGTMLSLGHPASLPLRRIHPCGYPTSYSTGTRAKRTAGKQITNTGFRSDQTGLGLPWEVVSHTLRPFVLVWNIRRRGRIYAPPSSNMTLGGAADGAIDRPPFTDSLPHIVYLYQTKKSTPREGGKLKMKDES